jgi:hypothetical protein
MLKWFSLFSALLLSLAVFADDPPKNTTEKKANQVFTDPEQAGPEFKIQGEYVGMLNNLKIGAHVIAQGDGAFVIHGYRGGLPGDGWDGEHKTEFKGKLENGKVAFGDDTHECSISDGKIMVKVQGNEFTMDRVVRKSPTEGEKPPEGAMVLFDGKNFDNWTKTDGNTAPSWIINNGMMQVNGGGDIITKAKFAGPHTIHVEFRLPFMPKARGQGRANSGVYIQNRYELQVLDSFGLKGLNNEAGGFYSQLDPKVNMCYPPVQWQTYDIDFMPAKFENGKKVANARATVKHNGVVVQDNVELKGPTPGGVEEADSPAGLRLQDHGNPVQFRNIWVVEKK